MEKKIKEFLKELKFNSIINKQNGLENTVSVEYVIERITTILESEHLQFK